VTLLCHGHGCPISKRTFKTPKNGKLSLGSALKQRHLAVHSTVEIQISEANHVAEVVVFTIVASHLPNEAFECLAPGARTPAACVSG
jgi:hypothetical protein